MTKNSVFDFEHVDNVLILIPKTDLRELEFDALEAGASEAFDQLGEKKFKHIVIDFHRTDYYGSTALAFFVKFWKRVKSQGGKMAFCEVSEHEREILDLTNLSSLWPIYQTREDAIKGLDN